MVAHDVMELLTRVYVLNTVALAAEAARETEVHPAVVLAFVDAPRGTTQLFVVWDIHRQRSI